MQNYTIIFIASGYALIEAASYDEALEKAKSMAEEDNDITWDSSVYVDHIECDDEDN